MRNAISTNGKPTVLVAEKLGAGGVEMLKQVADVQTKLSMSKEDLLEAVKHADALVIRSATKASAAFAGAGGRAGGGVGSWAPSRLGPGPAGHILVCGPPRLHGQGSACIHTRAWPPAALGFGVMALIPAFQSASPDAGDARGV